MSQSQKGYLEANKKGRTPDYTLNYFHKGTKRAGQIGCAWSNPDGSITVRFNPCTIVKDDDDVVFTLFRKRRNDKNHDDGSTEDPFRAS